MECRAFLIMMRLTLAVLIFVLAAPAHAGERQVVLIVSAASSVTQLDPIEIRKLFLGLPVLRANRALVPVRNSGDHQLDQVFLQDVVAMSQSAYDRRILAQVLKRGHPRPIEVESRDKVLSALYADPYAVSYAWLQDVAANPRIRVLRVLWSE